jgi:hypothetical protein
MNFQTLQMDVLLVPALHYHGVQRMIVRALEVAVGLTAVAGYMIHELHK